MMIFWTSVALSLIVQSCWCVPLDDFFPFGTSVGDLAVLPANGFATYVLSEDFIFYNEARRMLHVRTNYILYCISSCC